MQETVDPAGLGNDAHLNLHSLVEAVNTSSESAHMAWLVFMGLIAYLTIATAGVTHKDLLLETPVALPILQVQVQQSQFFEFAPLILLLFHFGLVSQLVLLARKTLELDSTITSLEAKHRRTHPLRLELDNFFYVQAVAGPSRSLILGAVLHAMTWLTLVILPVLLMLFIQVTYLPYHDTSVTWMHRITLFLDIGMLVAIGVFLTRPETSFFLAFTRSGVDNPITFAITFGLLLIVALISLLIATVPGEGVDRLSRSVFGSSDLSTPGLQVAAASSPTGSRRAQVPGTSLFGLIRHNIIASDVDFVNGRSLGSGDTSISLRGRDLRFAKLDRSNLRKADLTAALLDGATLIGTDLTGARLVCADLSGFIVSEDRDASRCASARAANFTRADLSDANLGGIDLRGATLEEATLEAADLSYATLAGANLASAHLDRAILQGGVAMQGANLAGASLQGADLNGALLQHADLTSAGLQGATLTHAHLEGALMRFTDFEGADLVQSSLAAADMSGAILKAADLQGAKVWMTKPPAEDGLLLSDMRAISMKPLDEADAASLSATLDRMDSATLKADTVEALSGVLNVAESRRWGISPEVQRWQALQTAAATKAGEDPSAALTSYLVKLMCKPRWSNGAIATGVVRRALDPQFRGSLSAIYDQLKTPNEECPASKEMSPKLLHELATAVDTVQARH